MRPTATRPSVFFFNDTATTEIYTLSLHDALPICLARPVARRWRCRTQPDVRPACRRDRVRGEGEARKARWRSRSGEHTSELPSRQYFVWRLLLGKNK